MTKINNFLSQASDLSLQDYCPFGLATCFVRDEGEIHQVKIVEPIPSAALEAIVQNIPTSYEFICGLSLGDFMVGDAVTIPAEFPQEAQLCDRFAERAIAACRTFKNRETATQLIPLGTTKKNLNYSLDKKRVLNDTTVIRSEDNVKQHEYTHKVL